MEYWGDDAGPMVWRLSPGEVRNIMTLRTDFSADQINQLKF